MPGNLIMPTLKIYNFGPIVMHHLYAFQRRQSKNALQQALNIDYQFTNSYGRIKTIKNGSKDIYNVTKYSYLK